VHAVALRIGRPGAARAVLRAVTGVDELSVQNHGLRAAAQIIARLLVAGPGQVAPDDVGAATMCDFDRILAALYRMQFGDQVECHATCTTCSEPYEFAFALTRFENSAAETAPLAVGPDQDGTFTLAEGVRFRLPTVADVLAIDPLRPDATDALLARCLLDAAPGVPPASIEAAMDSVGPTLSRTLDAVCPHCNAAQAVRFDLSNFLVAMFARERPFVLRELHLLARAYGWSAQDILALTRDDRRALVRLVEVERPARLRAVA
jgi:hypothetical protein